MTAGITGAAVVLIIATVITILSVVLCVVLQRSKNKANRKCRVCVLCGSNLSLNKVRSIEGLHRLQDVDKISYAILFLI